MLAALARAPLGLRSGRAVARAAGVSPTAAIRALRDLADLGLAELHSETVAEGAARNAEIAYLNLAHERWPALAPQLARVQPPQPAQPRVVPPGIPSRLRHLFWNAPVGDIVPAEHGAYIARRVLLEGDTQALAWAAAVLDADAWRTAAGGRGIDPQHRALAENLATSAASPPA